MILTIRFQLHFACPKRFELPEKTQLSDVVLPTSSHTTTRVFEIRAWWWFFNLVAWEEKYDETVSQIHLCYQIFFNSIMTFEIDPANLRALVKQEIRATCYKLDSSVQDSISMCYLAKLLIVILQLLGILSILFSILTLHLCSKLYQVCLHLLIYPKLFQISFG